MNDNKKVEILDKENFWDPLFKENPIMAEKFQKWIDEYKSHIIWDDLFNHYNALRYSPHYPSRIKFHHIPIEMQFGIFLEFTNSIHEEIYGPDNEPYLVEDMIKEYFVDHEETFNEKTEEE